MMKDSTRLLKLKKEVPNWGKFYTDFQNALIWKKNKQKFQPSIFQCFTQKLS